MLTRKNRLAWVGMMIAAIALPFQGKIAQAADVIAPSLTKTTAKTTAVDSAADSNAASVFTSEMTAEDMTAEIPEEILRTEIITAARSPLTGKPLSAADYAQLQAQLAAPAGNTLVSEDLRYLVFLLQLRQSVKPILPFVR